MNILAFRPLPRIQLSIVFCGAASLMFCYEFLKEFYFNSTETLWESHAITIVITALFATFSAYLMRSWVMETNEELCVAATAFETQEGMVVTDADSKILRVNHAFTEITGYNKDEVIGQSPRILSSGRHDKHFYEEMWRSVHRTGKWEGEIWNRRKNGEIYPERLVITAVKNHSGKIVNYVATLSDISVSRAASEEIRHLAFYDHLTRLPNRRLLIDRLRHALIFSARSGKKGALLFLDLDNFKTLNDTLGHDIGDLLLQQVALRTEACVRDGDTVARLGGDEFVVVLENLSLNDVDAASQTGVIAEKISAALNLPYQLGSHIYQCTPSIGAAIFNGHDNTTDELFKQADIAMYQSKKDGRNLIRFFDSKMQNTIDLRVLNESELRIALQEQQLHLYYQIQVDQTGRATGAEALIRWMHPVRGLVSPANFIPLAEESGQILPIGQWVLETACNQLKAWQLNPRSRELVLAVNVSAKQFHKADFVSQVQAAIERAGINPNKLKLELTESMLSENIDVIVGTMKTLKKMGVRFSLDDFGTGYSSLQYLKRLPLDQLKIDQTFVHDIVSDNSDKAIVQTIIAMARNLHLGVIAEGVENPHQHQHLLETGCTHFQGYLFGRPVPIEQFDAWLRHESLDAEEEVQEQSLMPCFI
jgi:diguanylate cyclase (GGDEF)-like protein/PAS domain S-box-containing protein